MPRTMYCDKLEIGASLCDMHYGFDSLKFIDDTTHDKIPHKVVSQIRFSQKDSHDVLVSMLDGKGHTYTNKFLVIVGENQHNGNLVAAWSYDGTTLGFAEIELNPKH